MRACWRRLRSSSIKVILLLVLCVSRSSLVSTSDRLKFSGINRSTHPEHMLARSVWFCRSKAPPSLHVTDDSFHYVESPFCCSSTSLNSSARCSDLNSSTTTANLRCTERGDISISCKVEASSVQSTDSPTASINNRSPSPILTSSPRAVVTSVESPQACASRVLTFHHYGLFRRIPPTNSSILQYIVSYTFMESEMKKGSTATTFFASFAASFTPRLVTGSIVQECGLARSTCYYVTVAFLTHYAVSSIDGSSQYDSLTSFLVAKTSEQECRCARFTRYYVTAAPLSHYAVSSIDGSSQSQLCDFQTGVGARRPNLPKAFYPLSDVCSHMFSLNECDDCVFRFPSGITCWARHGNVEFRVLNPLKLSSPPSIFILSTSLEVKLELEIHLVSSVSCVGFKAESSCFSVKSSHIRLLTLNIVYGSRASHLKLWSVNNTRCINVVFDYQLFLGTIAMGPKVELPFGFLHFAEHDSPLDGFIPSCFVMFLVYLTAEHGSGISYFSFSCKR